MANCILCANYSMTHKVIFNMKVAIVNSMDKPFPPDEVHPNELTKIDNPRAYRRNA